MNGISTASNMAAMGQPCEVANQAQQIVVLNAANYSIGGGSTEQFIRVIDSASPCCSGASGTHSMTLPITLARTTITIPVPFSSIHNSVSFCAMYQLGDSI